MRISRIDGCCSMLSLSDTEFDLNVIKSKKQFIRILKKAIAKYNEESQDYVNTNSIYSVMLISNYRHPLKFWLKRGFGYRLTNWNYDFFGNLVVYYVTFKDSLRAE